MMDWFSILKADIRNEAQYNAASLEVRRLWHRRQADGNNTRLNALQTQHSVDLTDVENPIYQEMKYYHNLRSFHNRQERRLRVCLRKGKTECDDYYSQELEGDNRRKTKLKTTPTGKLDPYVELSLEAYNNLTDNQKKNYHQSLRRERDTKFHSRMMGRITQKLDLPTFPSPKHGGESSLGIQHTREEYDNMTNNKKRAFHKKYERRAEKLGNSELRRFHKNMANRIKNNSTLPIFFSPEHEQEES